MLNKEELADLGYNICPDPDQEGKWYWRNDQDASEISFDSEAAATLAAAQDAEIRPLSRCDNCGKVHSEQTLVEAKDLSMRTDPNGPVPTGECPDCGALCYEIEKDPEWETVMDFFGLDPSFMWQAEDVIDYTQKYHEALGETETKKEEAAKALAFVRKVAELKKWGELDEEGEPFEPSDGVEDSHDCLMDLIDEARDIGVS